MEYQPASAVVNNPSPISINITVQDISYSSNTDAWGKYLLPTQLPEPTMEYGMNTQTVYLWPGTYTLTATDVNGCTAQNKPVVIGSGEILLAFVGEQISSTACNTYYLL